MTRGERVYLIREALGTRRDPMPLDQFAALIERASGVVYDKSTLSRMETGERKVSLEDIEAIAPVDPKGRGRAWLAGWDEGEGQGATYKPRTPLDAPRIEPSPKLTGQPVLTSSERPKRVRRKPKPDDRTALAV